MKNNLTVLTIRSGFIMLENLASKFELPCILDIKMGRRQHGDDASPEKKERHIKKCKQTTSWALGFRICGMQVSGIEHINFLYHDRFTAKLTDKELYYYTFSNNFVSTSSSVSLHAGLPGGHQAFPVSEQILWSLAGQRWRRADALPVPVRQSPAAHRPRTTGRS